MIASEFLISLVVAVAIYVVTATFICGAAECFFYVAFLYWVIWLPLIGGVAVCEVIVTALFPKLSPAILALIFGAIYFYAHNRPLGYAKDPMPSFLLVPAGCVFTFYVLKRAYAVFQAVGK